MQVILAISLFLNAGFAAAGVLIWRRMKATRLADQRADRRLKEAVSEAKLATQEVRTEYLSFASAVSECLREVRKDIDRNYCHTHDGHVLDRLAFEFESGPGSVTLDDDLAADIRAIGGGQYITGGAIGYGGALKFAWHVHEMARRDAGQMFIVVRESCGNTNRGIWLSKTLALYERICGEDKDEAIRSLSQVLQHWAHANVNDAVKAVV